MNAEQKLVRLILKWWENNQYDTHMDDDGEEQSVYVEEPDFVTVAKTLSTSKRRAHGKDK